MHPVGASIDQWTSSNEMSFRIHSRGIRSSTQHKKKTNSCTGEDAILRETLCGGDRETRRETRDMRMDGLIKSHGQDKPRRPVKFWVEYNLLCVICLSQPCTTAEKEECSWSGQDRTVKSIPTRFDCKAASVGQLYRTSSRTRCHCRPCPLYHLLIENG